MEWCSLGVVRVLFFFPPAEKQETTKSVPGDSKKHEIVPGKSSILSRSTPIMQNYGTYIILVGFHPVVFVFLVGTMEIEIISFTTYYALLRLFATIPK